MGEMVPTNKVRRAYSHRETDFFDTGCEHSKSCLQCPLPYCKYDVPAATQEKYSRDLYIIKAYFGGTSAAEISEKLGINERTVFLAIAGDPKVKITKAIKREKNG